MTDLEKYGRHDGRCEATLTTTGPDLACTCGLVEAIARENALRAQLATAREALEEIQRINPGDIDLGIHRVGDWQRVATRALSPPQADVPPRVTAADFAKLEAMAKEAAKMRAEDEALRAELGLDSPPQADAPRMWTLEEIERAIDEADDVARAAWMPGFRAALTPGEAVSEHDCEKEGCHIPPVNMGHDTWRPLPAPDFHALAVQLAEALDLVLRDARGVNHGKDVNEEIHAALDAARKAGLL